MAKSRYINTRIWEDNWFSELDQIEQLVFIYFLTNPMTNLIGIYEISKKTISRSVGLDIELLNALLERFEGSGRVFYRNGWIVLPNFIKHQNWRSPSIKKGIETALLEVPEELRGMVYIPYIEGVDTVSHLIKPNIIKSNRTEASPQEKEKEDILMKLKVIISKYIEIEDIDNKTNKAYMIRLYNSYGKDISKVEDLCKAVKSYSGKEYAYSIYSVKALYEKKPKIESRLKVDNKKNLNLTKSLTKEEKDNIAKEYGIK